MLEKLGIKSLLDKNKIVSHAYVLFFVMISFLIFDSSSLKDAVKNISGLFGIGLSTIAGRESIYYLKNYFYIFIIAMVGATPLGKSIMCKIRDSIFKEKYRVIPETIGMVMLLLISTAYLVDGSFNPFLYFRF